jgi:hypothetical protein
VAFVSEIEAVTATGFSQRGGVIDEKHGVVDIMFLTEFAEEDLCECVRSRRSEITVSSTAA